ncbi:MAG TPA: transcription termination factor NusA [Candidatus Krumholzibacteria bacterium]|nr:transcription termination factor NusA [Candidatus Krumholzibacteria bacterium]
MMDYNILDALSALSREKNVDQRTLVESLTVGLQSAAKKKVGLNADIQVDVDFETGEIDILQRKRVVQRVADHESEISLEEAQLEFGEDLEVGDTVKIYLDIADFGRNAIGVAKQVLLQKVREAERGNVYEEFRDRVGEVVVGMVQQVDRGNILVNINRVEALLPFRERIKGENYHQGKQIKAFIMEVQNNTKGPQIILSRTHPGFLKSLFESEVPEIEEGIVEIKAVARESGTRSKIAVVSHDDRVDAVGSCVGMKGSRVQAVTRELSGEKIDIVPWSADTIGLITRALSPARVNHISLDEEAGSATAIVDDDQLSLAIGREGKNVRLAAKLTGWRIDLVSASEYHLRQRFSEAFQMDVGDLVGVDEEAARCLKEAGITSVEELATISDEKIDEIPVLDLKTLEQLIATAQATMEEVRKQVEEMVEKEKAALSVPVFDEEIFGEQPTEEKKLEESDIFAEELVKEEEGEEEKPLTEDDLFKKENDAG